MPLIEVLLGSLGPAIGKSLLKLWLKDQELAVDVGSSVIDLLKQKGMDFATQRAGARAFERIGDEVAQSLKPLFKDARLEENEQEAVALAVAETLEKARIDTTLLAEKNLEPTVLAKFLIDSRALAARDLSERASTLYERILQEVARRIVAIAAQLPGFQVEALGEVLRREDELLRYAVEILEKVRELEEASRAANPTLRYAEFETKYRETVLRKLDRVQLIGVDVSATSREQRLSMAYISLRVAENWERLILSSITHITGDGGERETLAVTKEQVLKRLRAMGKEQFIQRSAALFDTSSFGLYRAATAEEVFDLLVQSPSDDRAGGRAERAVEEALAGRQRLLIRGIAGSGKTTLLKWIAVNAAGRKFSGRLEEWNDAVPFFLPLREYVDRE
ncbi:MAG TPA: NACHT domain-containing protein, partial [Ardenticatenaceae bacterium]